MIGLKSTEEQLFYIFLLTQVYISFIFHNILGLNLIIYFSFFNSKIFLVQALTPIQTNGKIFSQKKKEVFIFILRYVYFTDYDNALILGHRHACLLHYSNNVYFYFIIYMTRSSYKVYSTSPSFRIWGWGGVSGFHNN